MLKGSKFIEQRWSLAPAIFFSTSCVSIQLGQTMGSLEETVLEEKALLIDLQDVINNQKDHAFIGATTIVFPVF